MVLRPPLSLQPPLLPSPTSEMAEVEHLHVSYNDVHNIIKDTAGAIVREFQPDLLLAIGRRLACVPREHD